MEESNTDSAELRQALQQATAKWGAEDIRTIQAMEALACDLRDRKGSLLEAANLEAKASVLREKHSLTQFEKSANSSQPSGKFTPSKTESSSRPRPSSEVKLCPLCAEEIKFEALKCKHCGSMLANQDLNCSKSSAAVLQRQYGPIVTVTEKQLWLAIILCVFFGHLGAHSYYLEEPRRGKKFLITALVALVVMPLLSWISLIVIFFLWCVAMFDLWSLAEKVEKYNSRLVAQYGKNWVG